MQMERSVSPKGSRGKGKYLISKQTLDFFLSPLVAKVVVIIIINHKQSTPPLSLLNGIILITLGSVDGVLQTLTN